MIVRQAFSLIGFSPLSPGNETWCLLLVLRRIFQLLFGMAVQAVYVVLILATVEVFEVDLVA